MKTFSIPCIRPIWGENNCRLQENCDSLKDAIEQLKNKKEQIKIKVKREESPYQERTYKVTDWLYRADRLEAQAEKVIAEGEEEIQKRGSRCCCSGNCFSSSEVGKRVREKLNFVNQILIEGNFDVVVEKTPCDFVDVIDVETTVDFESKLDDVWGCLEDESIGIIGIYGMPGVGKTTLLKKIKDKFVQIEDYAVVIWVAASKEASIEDAIQNVIRKQLSISSGTWKNINKRDRAAEISRLLGSRKFILLLDDLRSKLNLLQIGVPLPNGNGSKVVFTSRSKGVCDDMKAQLELKLKCMSLEEALKLFSRNSVEYLAQTINADFCQGLPLAIVAVGQAMAGRNHGVWEHALTTLQNSPLAGMVDIFRIIESSFDSLEDDIIKDCFMYSCMLPSVIRKDELVKLWIGEGFLDTSDSNMLGDYIIKRLKLSCLLDGDEKSDFVRMHSVIQAFGLWLASEHGKNKNQILVQEQRSEKWTKATRISIYGQTDVAPSLSPCPQVQTLLITDTDLSTFPIGLQSMNALRVLNLSRNDRLADIPSSVGSLINLQYLNLSFTSIVELPMEVKNLANLKLFLVDYTENLQVMPKGVIFSFSSLQVFSKLGNKNFDDTALLEELECIEHMSDLSISLFSGLAVDRMLNSIKLQSCIRKLSLKNIIKEFNFPVSVLSRMVHLEELVIQDCKYLRFESDNTQYYVLNIRSLKIQNCFSEYYLRWLLFAPRLENLDLRNFAFLNEIVGGDFQYEEIKEIDERLGIFSNLKKLYLEDLQCLHYICHQALHFPVLEHVVVINCPNLLKLPFHPHSAKRLRVIKGSRSWWDHLHWEDEAVRVFRLKFQDVIEAEQTHNTWQKDLNPLRIEGSIGGTTSNTKGKSAVEPPIEIMRKSDRQAETAPSHTKEKGKSFLKSPIGIKRKPSEAATSKELKLVSESLIDVKKLGSCWPKPFTYKELVKATATFSNENLLGMGGFGKVYKGLLPNGELVAIKKFDSDSGRTNEQFLAEIETLSRIHHRNIIKLLGYCQNIAKRLLVYEFLPNNSLFVHLYERKLIIGWSIRMKVALGTAKGLAYLHEDCEPRIIHRDIKPSNILLDLNFEPKIAGFGIAVVLPDSGSDEIYENVAGTLGYIDPECLHTGKLTVKTDVFSFGVTLLELITGEKPYDYKAYSESEKQSLVERVKSILEEAIKSSNYDALIDPKLDQNYDKDEMERMICCAAACVYKPANLRPQMSQIVQALKGNIPLAGIWHKDDDTFLRDTSQFAYNEVPYRTSSSCEDDLDDLEKHGR